MDARVREAEVAAEHLEDGDNEIPPALSEAANGGHLWQIDEESRLRLRMLLSSPLSDPAIPDLEEGFMEEEEEERGVVEGGNSHGILELFEVLRDVFSVPSSSPQSFSTPPSVHPLEMLSTEGLQRDLALTQRTLMENLKCSTAAGTGGIWHQLPPLISISFLSR